MIATRFFVDGEVKVIAEMDARSIEPGIGDDPRGIRVGLGFA